MRGGVSHSVTTWNETEVLQRMIYFPKLRVLTPRWPCVVMSALTFSRTTVKQKELCLNVGKYLWTHTHTHRYDRFFLRSQYKPPPALQCRHTAFANMCQGQWGYLGGRGWPGYSIVEMFPDVSLCEEHHSPRSWLPPRIREGGLSPTDW